MLPNLMQCIAAFKSLALAENESKSISKMGKVPKGLSLPGLQNGHFHFRFTNTAL